MKGKALLVVIYGKMCNGAWIQGEAVGRASFAVWVMCKCQAHTESRYDNDGMICRCDGDPPSV